MMSYSTACAVCQMMHYTLPVVVDAPGAYVTRGGEPVTVTRVVGNRVYGSYDRHGIAERWSARGGRVLPFTESRNDIVGKASQ